VKCIGCGAEPAEAAQACPQCEAPLTGSAPVRMRRSQRYLLISVVFFLILYMVGVVGLVKTPQHSGLHRPMIHVIQVSLAGTLVSLVLLEIARKQFRIRQVAWALVPILSQGRLAFLPFLWLALIRRQGRDWLVFAAYLAAVVAVAGLDGSPDHNSAARSIAAVITAGLVVIPAAHAVVAFSPASGLPTWRAARAARGSGKRGQPAEDAAGPVHGGFTAVGALLLPWTWGPRFIFLGFILLSVTFSVPHQFKWIPLVVGIMCLAMDDFVNFGYEVERGDGMFRLKFNIPEGLTKRRINNILIVRNGAFAAAIISIALLVIPGSFLSASGQGIASTHDLATNGALVTAATVILLLIAWLLFGVPDQAHTIELDKDGYAQQVLVGIITGTACVLTGAFFYLLHLGSGALHDMQTGPLVAGIIFTALLAAPIYRSLARAIWQQGRRGVFSAKALKKPWRQASKEVRDALDRRADAQATAVSEKALPTTKRDRNTTTRRQNHHARR
jgi:hypothetical protein